MNKPHLWQIYTNVRYFCMVYSITELRIIKQRTFVHREATHVHIYWQNKAFLESIGVCRLSLTILALLYPTLPLCHFVPSFSGGVSNSCVSSRLLETDGAARGETELALSSSFATRQYSGADIRASRCLENVYEHLQGVDR